MLMRIKIDEDLPPIFAKILREKGFDAMTVIEQKLGGYKDPTLWPVVQKEERFLITADKGFADIRVYPPGAHSGVLLLRPDEDGIRPLLALLEDVLNNFNMNAFWGKVVVATPRGIRVRQT